MSENRWKPGEHSFINNLDNFRSCCRKVIALTFDSNWSLYENVCAVITKLNEVIESQNMVIDQINLLTILFEELKAWVTGIGLEEAVIKVLQEWYDNGKLEEIISKSILKFKEDKNSNKNVKLEIQRIGRKLYLQNDYSTTIQYDTPQGMCIIENQRTCVIALRPSGNNNTQNTVRLCEYSLVTGTLLRSNILTLYHANAIAYNEKGNILYIAHANRYVGGVYQDDNAISIVDYENFTITTEFTVPGIDYNKFRIRSCAYDNVAEKLYVSDFGNNYYTWEISQQEFTIIRQILYYTEPIETKGTNQTVKVYDNRIYCLFALPNNIAVFDINGQILQQYPIKEYANNSFFIGECEDIDIQPGGYIFMSSFTNLNNAHVRMCNFMVMNYLHNMYGESTYTRRNLTDVSNIYVGTEEIWRPTGEQNAQFNCIQEAIDYTQATLPNKALINVSGGSYEGFYINRYNIPVRILGESGNNPIINSQINIQYTEEFSMTRFVMNNKDDNMITLNSGNADISYTTFLGNGNNTAINATNHSDIDVNNCTFSNILIGLNCVTGSSSKTYSNTWNDRNVTGYYRVSLDTGGTCDVGGGSASLRTFYRNTNLGLFLPSKKLFYNAGNIQTGVVTIDHANNHSENYIYIIKVGGTTSHYIYLWSDSANGYKTFNTIWMNATTKTECMLGIQITTPQTGTRRLEIVENRSIVTNISTGAMTYYDRINESSDNQRYCELYQVYGANI